MADTTKPVPEWDSGALGALRYKARSRRISYQFGNTKGAAGHFNTAWLNGCRERSGDPV
jgi:hypothetical protein